MSAHQFDVIRNKTKGCHECVFTMLAQVKGGIRELALKKQHEKMFIKNKLMVGLTCLVALRSNFL